MLKLPYFNESMSARDCGRITVAHPKFKRIFYIMLQKQFINALRYLPITTLDSSQSKIIAHTINSIMENENLVGLESILYVLKKTSATQILLESPNDTPFIQKAMKWPHPQSVQVLQLLREANPEVITHKYAVSSATALYYAVITGQLPIVQYLLDAGVPVDETQGPFDSTALSMAAAHGHTDIVKLLFERGASLNSRDSLGHTPLYNAQTPRTISTELVRWLEEQGATL